MNYWQISAGDGTTDMLDIFIKLNIALIGPGRNGDYFDNKEKYNQIGTDGDLVRRFAQDMQIGDILVLKHIKNPVKKTWNILAIGQVIGPYRFEPIFDKVDDNEWDVQHCRRVKWHIPADEVTVQNGGAPIRLQKLGEENPLKIKAVDILKEINIDK